MDTRKALEEIGLPIGEADKRPGPVIKAFRENMVYQDQQTGN